MMSKEECLKALCRIQCGAKSNEDCEACECFDDKINSWKCVENTKESILIREVIEEHFELLNGIERIINKAKELSDSNDELRGQLYFPEPYKFEELKPNMWVWDNVAKECLYVVRPFVGSFTGVKYFSYLRIYKNLEEIKKLDIKFEENRFFPVQCANYLGGI